METTNPEMAKRLGDVALGILENKTGRDLGPKPTEADIAGLKQRAGNKAAVDFFDGKFGKGAAARYLDAGSPAAPKPASPAAAPAMPSQDNRGHVIPGMGFLSNSEIPARIGEFQTLFQKAQADNDIPEMMRLGNIIQALKAGLESPGV
jgi:hypothetical protein